jgi:acetyl-CoA C-acetyltransferase
VTATAHRHSSDTKEKDVPKADIGVIGAAIFPIIDDDRQSLEEILYDVVNAALADAKLTIEDIDGIVVASNDQFDGRAISIMAASGSVGGVNRDILATPSASEHAFVMGALRVRSGQFRTQLVVSWSPTEASSLSEAQRLGADPYFHRALPLDELSTHALQASILEATVAGVGKAARLVVDKNRANGARAYPAEVGSGAVGDGVSRWPITPDMTRRPVTGAVALVLAEADFVAERGIADVAWVEGMGWATEPSFLGDRDLSAVDSLVAAASQAYGEAGIADPRDAFDVAEVADATPYQELLAYDGLGLCPRAEWDSSLAKGEFGAESRLPVNLSGGALAFNPVFCTGLIRIAEVANQMRGRAGLHQRSGARRGLAHAASGFAMAYNTVVVLRRGEGAAQ